MSRRNQNNQMAGGSGFTICENMVREFITKEFLENLKLELCQKVKPSKAILEALKHSNTINLAYKRNIEQLNARISDLTIENQSLRERISGLQQQIKQKDNINNSLLYSASLKRSQSQRLQEIKTKESMEAANSNQIQVQILKEKIRHLEEYRSIKQARFTEIIERQAQYVGEINVLKYKNQTLEASVKTLESSLQKVKSRHERHDAQILQEKLTRKKSESSQKFRDYINQSDGFKSDDSIEEMRKIQHLIIPRQRDKSLLISCTRAVDIEEPYNLEAMAEKKKQENQTYNQIDLMLGEEVPNFNTSSVINDSESQRQVNINNSIIAINVNQI